MKKFVFSNDNNKIYAVKWDKVNEAKAIVVIVHGMAEHIERYDYYASILNKKGLVVYGYEVIGHGAAIIKKSDQGHWEKDDFKRNVENIDAIVTFVKGQYPGLKVILFGHSLGSFLVKRYMMNHGSNVDAILLSGTTASNFLMKIGPIVASLFPNSKNDTPNKFMHKLSFGGYNKTCKPTLTPNDWISTDQEQVKKYCEDPLCGFVCTTGFYKEFTSALSSMDKNSGLAMIPKNLPIYLFGGSCDPVSNQGKGLEKLYDLYLKAGLTNVQIRVYQGLRHETLNETRKDEVIKDTIDWINKQIA